MKGPRRGIPRHRLSSRVYLFDTGEVAILITWCQAASSRHSTRPFRRAMPEASVSLTRADADVLGSRKLSASGWMQSTSMTDWLALGQHAHQVRVARREGRLARSRARLDHSKALHAPKGTAHRHPLDGERRQEAARLGCSVSRQVSRSKHVRPGKRWGEKSNPPSSGAAAASVSGVSRGWRSRCNRSSS